MTTAICSCCGQVPEQGSVQLHSRRDIVICYRCLDWLNAKRDKKAAATGGAVRIVGVEPCFSVADVQRAVDHYQRLGFSISYHDEWYAFAHRDDLTIHLAHAGDPATGAGLAWTSSGQRITTTASAKAHTPTPTGTGSASDPRCGDQLQTDPASYHCSVITWRVASWVGGVGNAQSKLAQTRDYPCGDRNRPHIKPNSPLRTAAANACHSSRVRFRTEPL